VSVTHEGNPKKIIQEYFAPRDIDGCSVVVTGRKFKELINTHSIAEPQAIEEAFSHLNMRDKFGAIASLGGENFIVYCLNEKGHIDKVITGNKCASGTGEFFLQQIGRMNLSIDDAVEHTNGDGFYSVSGRCSVFCKSDCTHALNKGIEKSQVVSGLCKMIADKTTELLSKQKSQNVLLIGGVSKNTGVVDYIRNKYPNLHIPEQAPYFEALGASLIGLKTHSKLDKNNLFRQNKHSFTLLEPLREESSKVKFKDLTRSVAKEGDECILGLDVGSTTTKAVVIRTSDNALLASVYLRTNGNPVHASIECYKSLREQISVPIKIIGLGTTGSGRHISALHALTKGVVNEIIAHAVAAAYFDKEVDTIFEIGGQDAKYTHLTNGIASDYAMNEACSAGTGSFLEEAAKESLNINYTDIGDIAFTASHPLNFNDQCAAFISSDIKNASHDGALKEDIVAGLVYSICMNYVNRVKGNRPVGKKVFMQGGVCYNRAVPYAMANLVNKEIIVPPEPGLMGAFGVALEIKNRLEHGFIERGDFNLNTLINRRFTHGKDFVCAGGKEHCDRKCKVSVIEIENKKYPFGGACSKYYNQRNEIKSEPERHNYVKLRQDLVFNKYCKQPPATGKSIGISKSFLTNTLYPLYYNFFTKLGFKVVLPDCADPAGIEKMTSSFCYPVELSHGFFKNLLDKKVDYIFMPHITEYGNCSDHKYKRLCVFVQGEPYYIRPAFKEEKMPELLQPVIDLSLPEDRIEKQFIKTGKQLGAGSGASKGAFRFAYAAYRQMLNEFRQTGRKIIKELENNPSEYAMVLFGRAYNAFASEANLNIPHKIASKNITIIPHDFLPCDEYNSYDNMYWSSGQQIMKGARYVKDHDRLFGVFITNFSCGPDSFILSYFRSVMGTKPSLTLELDSHSADVGVETRIDAALDIIKNYNELKKNGLVAESRDDIKTLAVVSKDNKAVIKDVTGNIHSLTSNKVEIIIPSMGRFSTEAFSAVCRSMGMNSRPLPVPTTTTLKYGRGLTTCKECLPFILTTGQLVEFIHNSIDGKNVLFFMPHGYGPCRQGQYYILLKDIIKKLRVTNVGVLSMDDETSFGDLGNDFFLKGWIALMIADVVHDIESVIQTLAVDRHSALQLLEAGWDRMINSLERGDNKEIFRMLGEFSSSLSSIELKMQLEEAKTVSLIGEIYVRREEFSRGDLVRTLINNGFVVRTAPITEYIYYSNYLLKKGIVNGSKFSDKLRLLIKEGYQKYYENKIKKSLSGSMYKNETVDIGKTMRYGNKLVSEKLVGETILTIGLALREILDHACGVVSIGPFNCMPSRLSEAILNKEMMLEGKYRNGNIRRNGYPEDLSTLPFLYVETDGNPYPQITQSKLEIFMMQAEKVYEKCQNKNWQDLKKTGI
jgi:predicted CoA-substrate-specific enzyme activase